MDTEADQPCGRTPFRQRRLGRIVIAAIFFMGLAAIFASTRVSDSRWGFVCLFVGGIIAQLSFWAMLYRPAPRPTRKQVLADLYAERAVTIGTLTLGVLLTSMAIVGTIIFLLPGTGTFPLWLRVIGLTGLWIPAVVMVYQWRRLRTVRRKLREVQNQCAKCGYSLQGLPEPRCPECGTPFPR